MTDVAGEFWKNYEEAGTPEKKRKAASKMVAHIRSQEKELAAKSMALLTEKQEKMALEEQLNRAVSAMEMTIEKLQEVADAEKEHL